MLTEEYLFYSAIFVLIFGVVGIWLSRKSRIGKFGFSMAIALSCLLGFFAFREYQVRTDKENQVEQMRIAYETQLREDSIKTCEEYIAMAKQELERFKKGTFPTEIAESYKNAWEYYKLAKNYSITQDQKDRLEKFSSDHQTEYSKKMKKLRQGKVD